MVSNMFSLKGDVAKYAPLFRDSIVMRVLHEFVRYPVPSSSCSKLYVKQQKVPTTFK